MMDKELFIGIWQAPPATDENYKLLADCGINSVFLNGDYTENLEDRTKAVAFAKKYGIEIVLEGRNKLDGSEILESPLKESETVTTFNIFDEPLYSHEQPLRELASKVKAEYPDKRVYINLNPSYAPNDEIMSNYPKYVETFAKLVREIDGEGGWLSMDHYPLRRTMEHEFYLHEDWFTDVETTVTVAKKYALKPHFFIQSMAYGGIISWWNDRTPTEEDLRLQIYMYLAHGAKGFSHFCYQTPTTDEFFERQSGLFDKGAPTERWHYAQKIHGELKCFEKELVSMEWQECRRIDSTVDEPKALFNSQSGKSFNGYATLESVEADARCLLGCFTGKDGKEGFMLVNVMDSSKNKSVDVKMSFKKPTQCKVYRKGECSLESFDASANITLGVGVGIFMIEE